MTEELGERKVLNDEFVSKIAPIRLKGSRKSENGSVLIVGGSWLYHGAPTLAALAAYRAGVDLVYIAVPEKIATPIRSIEPSLIVIPLTNSKLTRGSVQKLLKSLPRIDSAAIGPGMALRDVKPLVELVEGLLELGVDLVLDASALIPDVLSAVRGNRVVLTPHAGEYNRLFGREVPKDLERRCEEVRERAKEHSITILLKGRIDIISNGDEVFVNERGTPAMTVGGSGDVLTGLTAGLLARGMEPLHAACMAAYVNCLAGEGAARELGMHILPTDMIKLLPLILKKFDKVVDSE